jgi:Platelet-activating factor acetylhydrolase, isoform II
MLRKNGVIAKNPRTFPVVLFSPGANMTCFQYTSAIEDLVSHGYVVAAIEHTSEVFAVVFANGNIRTYSAKRIPQSFLPPAGASEEDYDAKLQAWSRHCIDVRAADESFVLDKVTSLNGTPEKTSQFSGRLDLAHVAAVGHSRGGWASILTCRRDSRVRACVNEDGTSNGEGLAYPGAATPKQPILYVEVPPVVSADWVVLKELHLTPDEWVQHWHETAFKQFTTFPAGGYFVELTGMVHYSFADEVLLQTAKEGQKEKEEAALRGLRLTEEVTRGS